MYVKMSKKQHVLNWTYGLYGATGIVPGSLKSIGQF